MFLGFWYQFDCVFVEFECFCGLYEYMYGCYDLLMVWWWCGFNVGF